jgi:O-methyltransferase
MRLDAGPTWRRPSHGGRREKDIKIRGRDVADRLRHGRHHQKLLEQRRRIRRLRRQLASQERRVQELEGRLERGYADVDADVLEICELVKPYTMTGRDKTVALVHAARHIARTGLAGDFVECGVWRGGSVHAIARTLAKEGVVDRDLYLFDTFAGMTPPTDEDVRTDGRPAKELLAEQDRTRWVWAVASREDVEQGLRTLPYPYERFHLVEGPVEETVPQHAPERIALLRLDTDWYASTRHELEQLYDRLVPGGVLVIDDYGSWQGARQATDEFLARLDRPPLMQRAGRARVGVKP